jgi:hypothetical protein
MSEDEGGPQEEEESSSGSDSQTEVEDDLSSAEPIVGPSDAHSGLFEYFIPFVYRVLEQFVARQIFRYFLAGEAVDLMPFLCA